MSKKILVALDNSGYADKVMLRAIELARLYKAPLQGISVIDDSYLGDDCCPYAVETRAYFTISVQAVLDKCKDLAEKGDVDYSQEILNGNPAEEILKYAEQKGVDLIVLGHLGKSAGAGFLIGSVAQKVAAYSKCSVYIVK